MYLSVSYIRISFSGFSLPGEKSKMRAKYDVKIDARGARDCSVFLLRKVHAARTHSLERSLSLSLCFVLSNREGENARALSLRRKTKRYAFGQKFYPCRRLKTHHFIKAHTFKSQNSGRRHSWKRRRRRQKQRFFSFLLLPLLPKTTLL